MHRPTVWLPHIPRTAGQSRHEMLMHLPEYKRFDHKRNSNIPLKNNIVMGHMSVLESPDWIKILTSSINIELMPIITAECMS